MGATGSKKGEPHFPYMHVTKLSKKKLAQNKKASIPDSTCFLREASAHTVVDNTSSWIQDLTQAWFQQILVHIPCTKTIKNQHNVLILHKTCVAPKVLEKKTKKKLGFGTDRPLNSNTYRSCSQLTAVSSLRGKILDCERNMRFSGLTSSIVSPRTKSLLISVFPAMLLFRTLT